MVSALTMVVRSATWFDRQTGLKDSGLNDLAEQFFFEEMFCKQRLFKCRHAVVACALESKKKKKAPPRMSGTGAMTVRARRVEKTPGVRQALGVVANWTAA